MTPKHENVEELAYRENDGICVSLVWDRSKDDVSLLVGDQRSGEHIVLPVPRDRALDAFYHPYAYAA